MRHSAPVFSKRLNKTIKQVNRTSARKAFNAGLTVYLLPCLCMIDNMWISMCPIYKENEILFGRTFEHEVADFMYYNCCSELGTYPNYFIEIQ